MNRRHKIILGVLVTITIVLVAVFVGLIILTNPNGNSSVASEPQGRKYVSPPLAQVTTLTLGGKKFQFNPLIGLAGNPKLGADTHGCPLISFQPSLVVITPSNCLTDIPGTASVDKFSVISLNKKFTIDYEQLKTADSQFLIIAKLPQGFTITTGKLYQDELLKARQDAVLVAQMLEG